MKGMDRIIRGWSFKAVLEYCEGRGTKQDVADGRLIGGNMACSAVSELVREFTSVRRIRPDIEKATWHNSLRLPPGDRLEDDRWCEIVADYMQRMGFGPAHPYCIWAHDDESAVHIVACRIAADGSLYLGKNENLASTRHIQELERRFGLQITKGPEYQHPDALPHTLKPKGPQVARLKKAEIELAIQSGSVPPKLRLQKLIDEAIVDGLDVVSFAEQLEAEGVIVRANLASTGVLNGFAFELDGVMLKGSSLGKRYSWQGLQGRGVTYEQDRDCQALERYSAAARGPAGHEGDAGEVGKSGQPVPDLGADAEHLGTAVSGLEPQPSAPSHRSWIVDGASFASNYPVGRAGEGTGGAPDADGAIVGAGGFGAASGDAGFERDEGSGSDREFGGTVGSSRPSVGSKAIDVQQALSRDHAYKVDAWRRQAAALGAPTYRITLVGRVGRAQGRAINLGKGRSAQQAEKFFDPAAVEALIPHLRHRNAAGFDIYVTPIDDQHHFMVIDDMKPGASGLLSRLGYAPCLVQTSSTRNEQAVLKTTKTHRFDEQSLANCLVQEINKAHGDEKFSGVIHPFRMAGFSNKKPGRSNAFTRIIEAVPRLCKKAGERLAQLRDAADALADQLRRKRIQLLSDKAMTDAVRTADARRQAREGRAVSSAAAFHEAAAAVRQSASDFGWKVDESRVDFQASMVMFADGWTESETMEGLMSSSPALSGRHLDTGAYALRTVQRARKEFEERASKASTHPAPKLK
ncbi:MAG: hypothetical protein CFE46_13290 [Burkholderiales bacterium PBB6]|nr:MAG: hypothetical protein CFE46_13290 [Burkholderiales bacterium PBB6]